MRRLRIDLRCVYVDGVPTLFGGSRRMASLNREWFAPLGDRVRIRPFIGLYPLRGERLARSDVTMAVLRPLIPDHARASEG